MVRRAMTEVICLLATQCLNVALATPPAPAKQRGIVGSARPAVQRAMVGGAHPTGATSTRPFPERLAWQVALDRVGFSPGVIDGNPGRKTEVATREFQRVRGLPQTGTLTAATADALGVDPSSATTSYAPTETDLALVVPTPADWLARSRQKWLGYESIDAVIAEKFHCTRGLLGRLNPGKNLLSLQANETIVVPNVAEVSSLPRAEAIEIDLPAKIIRVLDAEQRLVGLFHCSIAAKKARRPSGTAHVEVVVTEPTYLFDPKMWPEVKGIDRKLLIPAGPRNPVGRCWIGLSLPGYGIHGTPQPEMIGKTGSHGCFRLTNWDAMRLGKMIRPGAKVRFLSDEPALAYAGR